MNDHASFNGQPSLLAVAIVVERSQSHAKLREWEDLYFFLKADD